MAMSWPGGPKHPPQSSFSHHCCQTSKPTITDDKLMTYSRTQRHSFISPISNPTTPRRTLLYMLNIHRPACLACPASFTNPQTYSSRHLSARRGITHSTHGRQSTLTFAAQPRVSQEPPLSLQYPTACPEVSMYTPQTTSQGTDFHRHPSGGTNKVPSLCS